MEDFRAHTQIHTSNNMYVCTQRDTEGKLFISFFLFLCLLLRTIFSEDINLFDLYPSSSIPDQNEKLDTISDANVVCLTYYVYKGWPTRMAS
jgi:hypothetical protein